MNPPPATPSPMTIENQHLRQYQLVNVTAANQQLLTHAGERIDLAKITDVQAAVLYRMKCKYIALAPQFPSADDVNIDDNVLADNDTNAYEIVDDRADSSPPIKVSRRLRKRDK